MRVLFLLILSISLVFPICAQVAWQWQKHLLFDVDSVTNHRSLIGFDYDLYSNAVPNTLMNEVAFEGKITAGPKNDALGRLQPNMRMGFQTSGHLWYAHGRSNGGYILVGLAVRDVLGSRFTDDLFGLYLQGNSAYEGDTAYLGNSRFRYIGFEQISIGMEKTGSDWSWGGWLGILRGSRFQQVRFNNSYLYTVPYGIRLDAEMEMEYIRSDTGKTRVASFHGWGGSLNGYLTRHWNYGANSLTVGVSDLGAIAYHKTQKLAVDSTYTFKGIEVQNVLDLTNLDGGSGNLDSLETVVGAGFMETGSTIILPVLLEIHYVSRFHERYGLHLSLDHRFLAGYIPRTELGVAWYAGRSVTIEPNISYGGWGNFTAGIGLIAHPGRHLRLWLRTWQFENLLIPDQSGGQGLSAGLGVLW